MSAVRWHATCPVSWPAWARDWACTTGSLTLRLKGLNRGFEVQPVVQRMTVVSPRTLPGACRVPRRVMRQRLVRLAVGGHAVVLAQTVMTFNGQASDWPFWRRLGKRSLGSVLFTDPQVHRGPLAFASLPVQTPWIQQLMDEQTACAGWDVELKTMRTVYARCARFERRPGHTPLWVMEVFLPALNHFKQDTA
ncbi:chorismate lyase [Limnobacter humi]|uniref:Chorismate lyase n=1 Tax=Limnobacter humi TaxID=1778671 RepID=A0ABT1WHK2_9BURK|nr:chorismate lyase [Limnobacter humi]MCQ8897002.1 chorismate lyase [Limnobacter humi]